MRLLGEIMTSSNNMKSQIAALESKVDLLESEIIHLDEILKKCGFSSGISTLKTTVLELLGEMEGSDDEPLATI